jgi:hypothetical protein
MIKVRKSAERGHANYGWLDTFYTFSFSSYYDPEHMGFRSLRVINEDFIEPGQGFPTHGHQDMEIITYVLRGELSHKDSMGNGTTILPNEVQRMTAGTGVLHSEYSSPSDVTHLLQIWIRPEAKGLTPDYEQTFFPPEEKKGKLRLVASRAGTDGSVKINQDVSLYASLLGEGDEVTHDLAAGRHAWVQVVRGPVTVNGVRLESGDGAAVSDETRLALRSESADSEFLLFDLN